MMLENMNFFLLGKQNITKEASIEKFNLLLNIQWILQRMDILVME